MTHINAAFSASYAQARTKFLDAASVAGMRLSSFEHPQKGRDGETLAMDVALDGNPDALNMLIVSSACHGVEGYCGSGVQVFAAQDSEWLAKARSAGVAVLYIHALNPHGFSWLRRTTHENVDLNRNFQDFGQPLPENADYGDLHTLLLPREWPPTTDNQAAIAAYIEAHGLARFQAAVSQGQYAFADGMFFGGHEPTWSNRTLRQVLKTYGAKAKRMAWMDLHTGLGPSGLGERIFACRNESAALARARAWWGCNGATPITSFYDGSSNSALLTGLMWSAIYDECPQAEYTGIAMEYGTLPILDMIAALRADHWLHLNPQAPEALRLSIQSQVLGAFYVDTDTWRVQIIEQARQALFQAVDGLCA
jgi:hypothetical protein